MKQHAKYIFIICLMMIFNFGISQSQNINGVVSDFTSTPIEGAVIILYDSEQNIVNHAITDDKGQFTFIEVVDTSSSLDITHLSYVSQLYAFTLQDINTSTINLNFSLEESSTMLDEIVFIGKHKEQDTVKFDLAKLKLYEDDNLKDILKKIPDFKLGDNGNIIYKGKNIDKILVNDKPSFESQNSIALESIENKIIDEISVLRNYSDNFSLDFDENQESVLNINTKNKSQNIINGDIEGHYGVQDKFQAKGKGLLFAQGLNAFLTHNTNNIGKSTITSNEVKKLFSEGQPFSPYQGESLGMLFSSNENLQKDFFSSTNLTIRNQTQRFKVTGLLYHIAPSRINSIIQNTSTFQNERILDAQEMEEAKAQSLLGAFSLAYKLSDRTILSYKVNANYIDQNNISTTENQLYAFDLLSNTNTTTSNSNNNIFSGFHQFSMDSKLRDNMILESKVGYFHEDTEFNNDYTVSDENTFFQNTQDLVFDKSELQGSVGIKYKLSDAFIPLLSMNYFDTDEKIMDMQSNEPLIDRQRNNTLVDLKVKGKNVIRGLDYEAKIGLNTIVNHVDYEGSKGNTFVPIKLRIEFERRMHRYDLKYNVTRRFSDLESGINTIKPYNSILNGNRSFPSIFSSAKNLSLNYFYNNFFDAELFSIKTSYTSQENVLRRGFVKQENGITEYQLFVVDKAEDFSINAFYSKTVSPLKFPTKIDFSLGYKQSVFPTQIVQQEVEVKNKSIFPQLTIETLNDKFVNYNFSSKLWYVIDELQGSKYNSIFTNNTFSILLRNKNWKGNIDFVFDYNSINEKIYSRKNINLGISYSMNKISYSIEARHLGELLGVFENNAYNSQFTARDGIINTIVNNQSLNYITFGVKYKLF